MLSTAACPNLSLRVLSTRCPLPKRLRRVPVRSGNQQNSTPDPNGAREGAAKDSEADASNASGNGAPERHIIEDRAKDDLLGVHHKHGDEDWGQSSEKHQIGV
jgi:hypothetical protein